MKNLIPNLRVLLVFCGTLLSGAFFANAQVLMFDFGPTTVTGADQENSPYHTVNESFTGTNWNKIQTADVSSLIWSDGTSATGVDINLGVTTSFNSTILNLGSTPSQNALGNETNGGVYAGTSVGTDGIFHTDNGTRYVGFQIGGLASGTYDVYVTSRNTNANSDLGDYDQNLYLGSSEEAGNFDVVALQFSTVLSYTDPADFTAEWVQGENYSKFSVTLGSGDYLNFGVVGTGDQLRGFLNSVQIVTVPEPSTVVLLLGGLGVLATRRRR